MKVRYLDETNKFDFIDNYQQFLEKCYKEFDMSEEEKKSLRISILDNDGDLIEIENEEDFNDNKSSLNDNNELICIIKSSGRPKNKQILEEIKTLIYETNENNKTIMKKTIKK